MEDEVFTPMKLNKKIDIMQKKIKVGNMRLKMIYIYTEKGDFSEPLNFRDVAIKENNTEYLGLNNECANYDTINEIKAGLNGLEEQILRDKKLLRNPKIQK